jgi:transposase
VVGLASELERAQARIAELEARLGRDSTNSSIPPSQDSIAAKAKRRADRSSRERSKDRKPGGQPGRKGSGLAPTVAPDRTQTLPPQGECSGCGEDLADAADAGVSWAQVWDIPPIVMEKVHYLLPRRRCGCGRTTTAAPPFGMPGNVVYGPNVNAAAILLASEGNVPLERTAMLMASLLGTPVPTGFVARALERFAQRLAAGGFDEAMTTALRAQDVLCADETPTNVVHKDTDTHGEPVAGSPHAVTVRTPDARLVYYAPIGSRSKTSLAGLGVLEGYTGYLVRDDYAGWHQFDTQLDGVQQCVAHLIRPRQRRPGAAPHPPEMGRRGHHRAPRGRRRGHPGHHRRTRPPRPPTPRRPARPLRPRSRLGNHHQPAPRLAQGQPPRIQPRHTPPPQGRPSLDLHPQPRRALNQQRQ